MSQWPQSLKTTFSMVMENGFAMALVWGRSRTFLYNQSYRPILGTLKHPSAMGRDIKEVFAEAWTQLGPLYEQSFAGNAVSFEDLKVPLEKDGELVDCFFTFSYSPVRDESGGVGGVLITVADVTERVTAQRTLLLAHRQAEAERENLEGFFLQAPVPMAILLGPDHVFAVANEPYLHLAGLSRQVLGKKVREAFTAEEIGPLFAVLDNVYATGQPFVGTELPLTLQKDAGPEELVVTFIYHPFRESNGAVKGILAVVLDVTEQVRAREKLEALTGQLQTAVAARDTFLGIASHELRTPLTSLKLQTQSNLSLFTQKGVEAFGAEKLQRLLENALRQTERLIRLVDDMLDISRIAAGKLVMNPAPTDLSQLTRDTVERFAPQFAEVGIDVELKVEPGVEVVCDSFRIEQVITNLLTNVIRYAAANPLVVEVTRHSRSGQTFAKLSVRDSGRGIEAQHLERIFDRFERIRDAHDTGGLGLGLYICKQIILAHGGAIYAASNQPRGATMTFEIPLRP